VVQVVQNGFLISHSTMSVVATVALMPQHKQI